ncbi:hypothetical protein pb186bvf_011835 [Paramecium bursaria]
MIRNLIGKRLGMNRFGLFKFMKMQQSEHQIHLLEQQQQYSNTYNIEEQLEIMKNIVITRQLTDGQDNISLETLEIYFQFIKDYQKCKRYRLNLKKDTASRFSQNSLIDWHFYSMNSFINTTLNLLNLLLSSVSIKQKDIYRQFQMEILSSNYYLGYLVSSDQKKLIEQKLKNTLNKINKCRTLYQKDKKYFQVNYDEVVDDNVMEFFYQQEITSLQLLAEISFKLEEKEIIKCYEQKLYLKDQLIKRNERISKQYLTKLYICNVRYGSLNSFRVVQLIEETCSQLENRDEWVILLLQRIRALSDLGQVSKKDYQQILEYTADVEKRDEDFQAQFYSSMIICAIQLRYYSEIERLIDLMLSTHKNKPSLKFLCLITDHELFIQKEFMKSNHNHPKVVQEKTISYYQEKAQVLFSEVQRNFAENYFNQNSSDQRVTYFQICHILKYYLNCSIQENDYCLIKVELERMFQIFQKNPNYREAFQKIFKYLNGLKENSTNSEKLVSILFEQFRRVQIKMKISLIQF